VLSAFRRPPSTVRLPLSAFDWKDAPMATETLEEPRADEELEEDGPPQRMLGLSGKKIRILLLLIVVMAVEAAGFYLLVPKSTGSNATGDDAAGSLDNVETVEVAFDSFQVYNGSAAPGSRLYIEFKLTNVVAKSQEIQFDLAANRKHKASVKQVVQEVVSSSSLTELNDPRLSVIRRKIKEEINKVLRKSYVNNVILTDYRVSQQ
jgi:flagellar basal body-associated protein FliL